MFLKASYFRQPVWKFRYFSACLHDCLLLTDFDTFSALVAGHVIDHMDILRTAFDTVKRTYIHTFPAAVTELRINIDSLR